MGDSGQQPAANKVPWRRCLLGLQVSPHSTRPLPLTFIFNITEVDIGILSPKFSTLVKCK